jgi:protein Tex
LEEKAQGFLSEEKEVTSVEEVLEGAKDILAETFSDEPSYRQYIRDLTFKQGKVVSTVKKAEKDEKEVYACTMSMKKPYLGSFLTGSWL